MLLVSAALGIGAAGCDKTTYANHYGTSMMMPPGGGGGTAGGGGTSGRDMAVPDLGGSDGGEPDGGQ
jgi:hypothetical protein